MGREEVLKVLRKARPGIARHWLSCIESGLPGFTAIRVNKVDNALAKYCAALGTVHRPSSKDAILAAMKTLFKELDRINEEAGGGLLETDERELLVPVIIDAASAAGLDVSEFEDGDPTGPFRNF